MGYKDACLEVTPFDLLYASPLVLHDLGMMPLVRGLSLVLGFTTSWDMSMFHSKGFFGGCPWDLESEFAALPWLIGRAGPFSYCWLFARTGLVRLSV
ncbi:hypothetical protein Tco_0897296 [Tanacetum coccineum]